MEITKKKVYGNKSLEIIINLERKYNFERVDKLNYLWVTITESGHDRAETVNNSERPEVSGGSRYHTEIKKCVQKKERIR